MYLPRRGSDGSGKTPNPSSLVKRGINGVYHHVGKGHLSKYLDEFAFKYESRKMTDAQRAELLMSMASGKRLLYKEPDSSSRN